MMMSTISFESFGLADPLLANVARLGFTEPTPVQTQAIPAAMRGGDWMVSSQTGSGKTAAFLLPVLHTLLRLAEPPRLYAPRWSQEILTETTRALETKLNWPRHLVAHFETELRTHFADAWVDGYGYLMESVGNDVKDRHVLAAAAHSATPLIITFNLRHFKPEHLHPWGITALHPDRFLVSLMAQEPELVRKKVAQQAEDRHRSLSQLAEILRPAVPEFAQRVLPFRM